MSGKKFMEKKKPRKRTGQLKLRISQLRKLLKRAQRRRGVSHGARVAVAGRGRHVPWGQRDGCLCPW